MWMKELKIFIFLFVLLSVGMHFSVWVSHPLAHIEALSNASMGIWHPIFLTLLVYVLIMLLRLIVKGIRKLLFRK